MLNKSVLNNITVLISTYNDNALTNALESLQVQTYKDFEIILINDGGENIDHIINQFNTLNINCYNRLTNCGLTKSLNFGISKVKTKYIARMDSDDYALPERLELQLEYLEKEKLDLIGSAVIKISGKNKDHMKIGHKVSSMETIRREMEIRAPIAHPTFFGKAKVFRTLMYNENLRYSQDYDFLARAIINNVRVGNLNLPLVVYSNTGSNNYKKIITQMHIANEISNRFVESIRSKTKYKNIELINIKLTHFDKVCLKFRQYLFNINNKILKKILFLIYLIISLLSNTQRKFNIRNLKGN